MTVARSARKTSKTKTKKSPISELPDRDYTEAEAMKELFLPKFVNHPSRLTDPRITGPEAGYDCFVLTNAHGGEASENEADWESADVKEQIEVLFHLHIVNDPSRLSDPRGVAVDAGCIEGFGRLRRYYPDCDPKPLYYRGAIQ